jgi:hypothetical protein
MMAVRDENFCLFAEKSPKPAKPRVLGLPLHVAWRYREARIVRVHTYGVVYDDAGTGPAALPAI